MLQHCCPFLYAYSSYNFFFRFNNMLERLCHVKCFNSGHKPVAVSLSMMLYIPHFVYQSRFRLTVLQSISISYSHLYMSCTTKSCEHHVESTAPAPSFAINQSFLCHQRGLGHESIKEESHQDQKASSYSCSITPQAIKACHSETRLISVCHKRD